MVGCFVLPACSLPHCAKFVTTQAFVPGFLARARVRRPLRSKPKLSTLSGQHHHQVKFFTTSALGYSMDSLESPSTTCVLNSRRVLRLSGPDTLTLLQGLVTNDVNQLTENSTFVQYTMMLNVQGRVLYDLFLYNIPQASSSFPTILVDVDKNVKEELIKLLRRYKLRKKVDISDVSEEYTVTSNWGLSEQQRSGNDSTVFTFADPRVPQFGNRTILAGQTFEGNAGDFAEETVYRSRLYQWGIPEGVTDLPPGACLPLESNLALMNGVSFQKGCYIGQELTARTHHTGVTRKRLMPLSLEREVDVTPGSSIQTEKGKNAGKLRSKEGKLALGLIRLTHVKDSLCVIGQDGHKTALSVHVPNWWPSSVTESAS